MATWKCDVKMQYGKYSAHLWKATERPGVALAEGLDSSKAAIARVVEGVQKAGFSEGEDEVIFRDIAHGSLAELKHAMSRAPY